MTFPLDPGLRAFQAEEAEQTLRVDPSAQPVPPADSQAEDAKQTVPAEDAVPSRG